MRHYRSINSPLFLLTLIVCLGLPGAGQAVANSLLADEQSLDNGAQLYDLYCSECHGHERTDDAVEPGEGGEFVDYTKLIDAAQAAKAEKAASEEDWPPWAEQPDPDEVSQADVRSEVESVITAEIDKAHANELEADAAVAAGLTGAGGFEAVVGAPNLADPQSFHYGTSEEEVFKSIAKGTGAAMPGWRDELGSSDNIRDVVNYIRSFWGDEWLY